MFGRMIRKLSGRGSDDPRTGEPNMREQIWMQRTALVRHLCDQFGVVSIECEKVLFNGLDWREPRIEARNSSGQIGAVHELLKENCAGHRLRLGGGENGDEVIGEGFGRLSADLHQLDEFGLEINALQAETYFQREGYILKVEMPMPEHLNNKVKSPGRNVVPLNKRMEDVLVDRYLNFPNTRKEILADSERWLVTQYYNEGVQHKLPAESTIRNIANRARKRYDGFDDIEEQA